MWRKAAYLTASIGALLIDQGTKIWARETLRFGDPIAVVPNFLNFDYAENTGVAFSQLAGGGETGRWVLSAVAGVAALVVLYFFWRIPLIQKRVLSAFAFLLAGILGNFTSRVSLGFVVDWIDVQFGSWHYPTFNLADVWICTGAGLLVLDMFLNRDRGTAGAMNEGENL